MSRQRGRFARLAVELDLAKPLITSFFINGVLQRVEYESLPTVCFRCGRVGHGSERCSEKVTQAVYQNTVVGTNSNAGANKEATLDPQVQDSGKFGPWIHAKKTSRRQFGERRPGRDSRPHEKAINQNGGSRFSHLKDNQNLVVEEQDRCMVNSENPRGETSGSRPDRSKEVKAKEKASRPGQEGHEREDLRPGLGEINANKKVPGGNSSKTTKQTPFPYGWEKEWANQDHTNVSFKAQLMQKDKAGKIGRNSKFGEKKGILDLGVGGSCDDSFDDPSRSGNTDGRRKTIRVVKGKRTLPQSVGYFMGKSARFRQIEGDLEEMGEEDIEDSIVESTFPEY